MLKIPLLHSITFFTNLNVRAINSTMVSCKIFFHISRKTLHVYSCEEGQQLRRFLSSSSHKNSIGLRCGLWRGHIMFLTSLLFLYVLNSLRNFQLCFGSLSGWKKNTFPINLKQSFILAPFTIPSTCTKTSVPCPEKHPQIIIELAPCFTLSTTQYGIIITSALRLILCKVVVLIRFEPTHSAAATTTTIELLL